VIQLITTSQHLNICLAGEHFAFNGIFTHARIVLDTLPN
jgi:hypothetical protein